MSHILILEDDPALRELYALMLSHDGHAVTTAENGLLGLAHIRAEQPDVVLTDIVMPELDGIGFIRAARQEHPELRIIAMSGGLAASGRLVEAAVVGACFCLPKPFGMAELRHAVNVALGLAREAVPSVPACATA